LGRPLNGDLLRAAARLLTGRHEFRAFAAVGQDRLHYRCNVIVSEWQARPDGEGFIFTIEADRFLHRMVRFLVGTMVDIGRERRPLADVDRLLVTPHNHDTSPPAPPHGLFFVGARYPQLDEGYDR
jgi:tRNA pseudouridine38-40 synthase